MNSKTFSVMSFTNVMDKAFDIHRKHMGTSALYLLLYFIISIIAYMIVFFVVVLTFTFTAVNLFRDIGSNDVFSNMNFGAIIMFTSFFILIFFLALLSRFVKEVGIIDIASKVFLNKRVQFDKALGLAFKKIPAILTIIIAYTIIFLPMFIAIVLLVLKLGIFVNFNQINIWIILLGLGFSILYIYLATIYMFSIHVAVLENLYFFKALKRSRVLVKNNFWRLFGINILFSIIVLAITYSLYSFFGVIAGLIFIILNGLDVGESTMTALLMIGNVLQYPLQIIFSLFISPLTGIFSTILYYNQRFKKEGYDIELELENLKDADKIIKEKKSEIPNTSINNSNEREI